MKMRYLIFGGSRIFGEGLIELLLAKKDTEAIISTRLQNETEFCRERLSWEVIDLRNAEETNRLVNIAKADIIFDFVTQDSVGYAWEQPTETVDINIVGTVNLLNAIRDFSPNARLVIGGSGEEYGHLTFDNLPVKEDVRPLPNNIFGATKACQTMFAKLYHQAFGMDIVVVRTFYEMSEKQNERFAVSSFCKQFAEIEAGKRDREICVGNLNNIRDFTDVQDLVRAFMAVAEKGKSGEIYNAASGKVTTLLRIVEILEELTGIDVNVKMVANLIRPMDSPAMVADINKIKQDCGWEVEIPIKATVERILNTWRLKI